MSLLKDVIKDTATKELIESAAGGGTSAGAVAGFRAPIGGQRKQTRMRRRVIPNALNVEQEEEDEEKLDTDWNKEVDEFRKRAKKDKGGSTRGTTLRSRRRNRMSGPTGTGFSLRFESILGEGPEDENFDPSDVISKLRSAQEKSNNEDDTTGFALEDTDGQLVKVYVASDEAEEFERALGAALGGEDEDDDHENTALEIAEVLFNLKDRFAIVDVVWPQIEGDPEEQETSGDELDTGIEGEGGTEGEGAEGAEGGEGAEGEDGEIDLDAELSDEEDGDGMEADAEAGDEEDVKSALASVIDLLRSQADAQKAEANAKEAEANAEEAKYNARTADSKMKQEEEVLDMEAYYADQKKADSEAKKLKDLAKWKHETAQDADAEMDSDSVSFDVNKEVDVNPDEEEEEKDVYGALPGDEIAGNKFEPGFDENRNRRMSPGEFIKYILQHQRRQ